MRINLKAIAGFSILVFAVTGWALMIAKQNQLKALNSEKEEEKCCETVPPLIDAANQINADLKQQQRFVWEINTRDGIIDYKNGQIEELNKELEEKEKNISSMTKSTIDLVSTNLNLRKKIAELEKENKAWEEYADDNEQYMDYLEEQISKK